ncbi:MAG: hypothetical protein ACK58J_06710 [Planctomyces sp.]
MAAAAVTFVVDGKVILSLRIQFVAGRAVMLPLPLQGFGQGRFRQIEVGVVAEAETRAILPARVGVTGPEKVFQQFPGGVAARDGGFEFVIGQQLVDGEFRMRVEAGDGRVPRVLNADGGQFGMICGPCDEVLMATDAGL